VNTASSKNRIKTSKNLMKYILFLCTITIVVLEFSGCVEVDTPDTTDDAIKDIVNKNAKMSDIQKMLITEGGKTDVHLSKNGRCLLFSNKNNDYKLCDTSAPKDRTVDVAYKNSKVIARYEEQTAGKDDIPAEASTTEPISEIGNPHELYKLVVAGDVDEEYARKYLMGQDIRKFTIPKGLFGPPNDGRTSGKVGGGSPYRIAWAEVPYVQEKFSIKKYYEEYDGDGNLVSVMIRSKNNGLLLDDSDRDYKIDMVGGSIEKQGFRIEE